MIGLFFYRAEAVQKLLIYTSFTQQVLQLQSFLCMVATLQMDRIMSGPRLPVARCDAFARCQAFGSRFAGTMPRNIQAKQHLGGTIVAAHDAASMGTPEHESPDLSSSDRQSGAPSTSQSSDLSEGKSSNGFTRYEHFLPALTRRELQA